MTGGIYSLWTFYNKIITDQVAWTKKSAPHHAKDVEVQTPVLAGLHFSEDFLQRQRPELSVNSHGRRGCSLLLGLFYKGTDPIHEALILMIQSPPKDSTS